VLDALKVGTGLALSESPRAYAVLVLCVPSHSTLHSWWNRAKRTQGDERRNSRLTCQLGSLKYLSGLTTSGQSVLLLGRGGILSHYEEAQARKRVKERDMSLSSDHEEQANLFPAVPDTPIILALGSLLVLCGPAGSGKSTFARTFVEQHQAQRIKATAIVSSDLCRALVCDDEGMKNIAVDQQQQVQQSTFELFYSILAKRLALGRLSIADTLALHENIRRALLEIARKLNAPTCLLVFNMSLQTCLAHNQHQTRTHRIPEHMIAYQVQQLPQVLLSLPQEGWDQIHILDEHHPVGEIVITP